MSEENKNVQGRVPVPSEKLKALQAAMDKIEKSYGRGAIMKMGDDNIEEVAVIPTGSIGLNAALGVGGYPRGRVIEIYGPESSGKTTLAIHAIAEAQRAGTFMCWPPQKLRYLFITRPVHVCSIFIRW